MKKPFSIAGQLQGFVYAFRGIAVVVESQLSAWIHVAATIMVCSAGFYFRLTGTEWCEVILAMVVVWVAEALNTAIEFLGDAVSTDYNPLIGKAKDVAAGAVLISAIGAVVIGLLVFGPHLLEKFPNLGKF